MLDDALDLVDLHGRVEPRGDLRVDPVDDLRNAAAVRRREVAVHLRERLRHGGADAGVVERPSPAVALEDLQRGGRAVRCCLVELDGGHRSSPLPTGFSPARRGCATDRTPTCGV
ncbi:Uncharacterised protein [Mycobacteroides abscessus]|nr:Uncharacterised protein [Mycobacteroides abscessus]